MIALPTKITRFFDNISFFYKYYLLKFRCASNMCINSSKKIFCIIGCTWSCMDALSFWNVRLHFDYWAVSHLVAKFYTSNWINASKTFGSGLTDLKVFCLTLFDINSRTSNCRRPFRGILITSSRQDSCRWLCLQVVSYSLEKIKKKRWFWTFLLYIILECNQVVQ